MCLLVKKKNHCPKVWENPTNLVHDSIKNFLHQPQIRAFEGVNANPTKISHHWEFSFSCSHSIFHQISCAYAYIYLFVYLDMYKYIYIYKYNFPYLFWARN